jgi:hypothetical protein
MDAEFERQLREYAGGTANWEAVRESGRDYAYVLGGLGEFGLRPPAGVLGAQYEQASGPYRIAVVRRMAEAGGGWRLHGYEAYPGRDEEIEVHRSTFAPGTDGDDGAWHAAVAEGQAWLAKQPRPEYRDGEHYMLGLFARDAAVRVGE